MKKLIYCAAALVTALFAGSCQRELLDTAQSGSTVTFAVEIPEVATKAAAVGNDASMINDLVYEVYKTSSGSVDDALKNWDKNTTFLYAKNYDVNPFNNGSATISLELLNDQNHIVLLWAQHDNTWVAGKDATALTNISYPKTLSVNASEADKYAAFSKVKFIAANDKTNSEPIVLTRPFAQINIATLDPTNYNVEIGSEGGTVITVNGAGSAFNVASQSPAGTANVTYTWAGKVSADPLTVNSQNYDHYLAMGYVFASDAVSVDYTITTTSGHGTITNSILNVPVAKNFRTNIIGNLLTSDVKYNVTLDKEWGTPDTEVEVWNGTAITEPQKDANDENVYEIEFASELAWLAAAVNGTLPDTKAAVAAQDFAGKTFKLMNDIDLCGYEWTPIGNGKHFKGTFDGQGHTIKRMTITEHAGQNAKGLFGIVSGKPTIKNLVIDGANVVMPASFDGDFYAAGLVGSYYGTLTVENVTVQNSTFAGNNKVAGLLAHDALCSNLKIDNCHVLNCNISSTNLVDGGNVGGLLGLFQGEKDGEYKITNSSVKNSTIVGINSSNTGKRANGEFVACVSSKESQTLVIKDCVVENNTFTQTIDGTEPVTYVGPYDNKFVGGERNGYEVLPGVVIIDGAIYVTTAANLQAVLDAATSGVTVKFGADIEGNVTVVQKQGVKITIDGCNKKYNGFIKVHSNSEHYADAALTIKNVNFETSTVYYDSDNEPYFNFIEALENGAERYSTNITVDNCTFTATGDAVNEAVALQIKSSKWAKALNCTATDLHSLVQAQSCDETVVVNGCTITGKNGVAFKQVKAATVEGTTITAAEYGIRFDGNTDNYGITVKDNNVTAVQPLIVRKMTGANNTIDLEGTNTLNTEAEYQIVITNGSDDEAYVKPTGTYELTGADAYTVFPAPFPVASWDEFTAALAAGEDYIKLTANIEYASNYQLQKSVKLDLGGNSMTLPMINIHTKTTIKNGTINGKVYARKNSEIVFNNVKFSGAVADDLSTEGHLAIQGGCKSLYAKDCLFSPTSVSGSQTKPLSFEGGSTIMKFENCEFKSSPYKKQVYFNSLSAAGSLDFTNCNFNTKTPNIMFAAACPLTNITMSGTTKLSSVTFEINRAKEAVTDADLAYLRTLIANNSFSSVRLFYAGGSSEYIR